MNIDIFRKYLKDSPITLIDIGARSGIDHRWNEISELLEVIGFEPDVQECDRINYSAKNTSYSLRCLPYALGSENIKKSSINICKSPGCSSLYEPNTDFVKEFYYGDSMEVVDTYNVSLRKLDEICSSENIKPDCIKIDTQGTELDIIKGGEEIIKKTKFLELEVEFNCQYYNQPLFSDVDLYLREQGFVLLGLRRTFWRRIRHSSFPASPFGGQIMHGDVIYYNLNLLKTANLDNQADIIKLCIILSIYKQDDLINYLLSAPHNALLDIPEDERIELARALQDRPLAMPRFLSYLLIKLRKKFYLPQRNIRKFADKLQDHDAKDWHDHDFF